MRGLSQGRGRRRILLLAAGLLRMLHPKQPFTAAELLQFLVPSSFTACAPAGVALAAAQDPAARHSPQVGRLARSLSRRYCSCRSPPFSVIDIAESSERITGSTEDGQRRGICLSLRGNAMSDAAEVRQLALDEFDQRYAALRLQATAEARQAMVQSLGRYGQISPLVVWPSDDAWVLIDGFKRVEAAKQVPGLDTLGARLIDADPKTAKAAIYGLNRLSRPRPLAGRGLDRVRLGSRRPPDAVRGGPTAGA